MDEYNTEAERLAAVFSDDEEESDPRVTVAQSEEEKPRATVAQGEDDVSNGPFDIRDNVVEPSDMQDISGDSGNIEEQTGNISPQSMDISIETNAYDAEMDSPDFSEIISDIVEKTVDAVISGNDMDSVLERVNEVLPKFYADAIDSGIDMETITGMIADAVHEIASVFESPDAVTDSILSVLPDSDVVDEIRDRIEDVHADMTVESYGTLGEVSFDADGLLLGTEDVNLEASDMETSGVDVDSTITELDSHMDAVSREPEFQDLISGYEWAQEIEAKKLKDTEADVSIDTGMELTEHDFPEIIEMDVSYDPDLVDY